MSEILTNFLTENEKNYVFLRNNLSQYKNIFKYVYLNVFPEIHCATERRGFDLKSIFHIVFKADKGDKKKVDHNNDKKLDDVSTVGYNSDADVNIIKPMTIKPETSITQEQLKK